MSQRLSLMGRCLLIAIVFCAALAVMTPIAAAQDELQPAKGEGMGAYSYYNPGGSVTYNGTVTGIQTHRKFKSANAGFNTAASYFFGRYFGLTVDSGLHLGFLENFFTIQGGPTIRIPIDRATIFMHGLAGIQRIGPAGAQDFRSNTGVGLMTGGGMDLRITNRWAWRVFEADYQYAHHSYGAGIIKTNLTGARVGSGIVYLMGIGPPPVPPSASCTAQPTAVMAGEPVSISASPSGFKPNHTLAYNYTVSGGKVQGSGGTVSIDTTGLAPGSYNVSANVSDGKKTTAQCSTSFTVNSPAPLTVSCTANPSTVTPGGSSTIDCTCNADGRPTTFKYSASAGTISGTGPSARLDTTGAPVGTITVTTTCNDDRGRTATTDTPVNVQNAAAPTPPPAATATMLNEIAFKPNSSRVDNTAKAILDDVALRLQRETDSQAVIVGYTDASEGGKNLAAQRAVNTKAYLVNEKGIDSSRISVRSDGTSGMKAEIYLVPAGATYDNANATAVDESTVRATKGRAPARRHRRARRKAAATPAAADTSAPPPQ